MRRVRWRVVESGERGSAAIEAVIGVTAFVMLGSMIIAGGRVAITQQAIEAAAAQAAREASIARDPGAAQAAALSRGLASLDNQEVPCTSRSVVVDTTGFAAPLGVPAETEATVTCVVDLSDVSLPGMPGSLTITGTMSSPIDAYRER
ncbi:TadE/TadG family type IV pilus assembly protein [Myceligenerans indicum]|uniref:Pilus assembly protein n=1 Tax=Myceligenerans indicum TaxID=2593663 RepID=A0ABS1LG85_9MICO|nr:TadE/TadG family type IV pilus assembly protein [Myceligenerans indicum]MBL0884853.1 pilus assembly protein [Myceligenerans indicum]